MAHTNLEACNKALDRERAAQQAFEQWAEYQINEYRKEAAELEIKAAAIAESLSMYRAKRKMTNDH